MDVTTGKLTAAVDGMEVIVDLINSKPPAWTVAKIRHPGAFASAVLARLAGQPQPEEARAGCESCRRADNGGGYPCGCPVPCGARYCQHPMPGAEAVTASPAVPSHADEATAALRASEWQRQQWGEGGSKDDLRSAAWELERAKVHALLGIEAAVSRLAAAPGPHPAAEDGELRVRIHRHLKATPGSTAQGLAAVLKVPASQVLAVLMVMEDDGEASRDETGHHAAAWRAT